MKLYIFEECWSDGQRWDIGADTFQEALSYFIAEKPQLRFAIQPAPDYGDVAWNLVIPAHDGPMYIGVIEKEIHKGIL